MAEGDTIHRAAQRLERALVGEPLHKALAPAPESPLRRQAERLASLQGKALERAEARGKHLLLRFEGGLVLHSHLGMRGSWRVAARGARWDRPLRTAWVVLSTIGADAAQFGGSRLALPTDAELRADPRLRSLGPDLLADDFTLERGFGALRRADQSRELGEALLDQRLLSGIGNVYKAEGCFAARVSPWRGLGDLSDEELERVIGETAALMRAGLESGRQPHDVYRRPRQPCLRCGARIRSRGQGGTNRTTYWCPRCQR